MVVPLVVALFVISRLGYLNLPFYWDEAWSYATAVFTIAGEEPVLLPGHADPGLTRGHPLLFYYLSSLWITLMGSKLSVVHLFPLLVAVALLIAIFFTALKGFNPQTALVAIILIVLQAIFLAQSTQLLPEIMLSLWTLLTAFAYFSKRWAWYALFSTLLVMTKESGMVLIGVLFIDKCCIEHFFRDTRSKTRPIFPLAEWLILGIPLLVFTVFMVLQKREYGWYLYPEHLNLTVIHPTEVFSRFHTFLTILFFGQGRFLFFALSAIALVILVRTKRISKPIAHRLLFALLFTLSYLAFSSVNFFSTRYLVCLLPFYVIPGSWLITNWLEKYWQMSAAVLAIGGIFAWFTFFGDINEQDTSLGYKKSILLQKEAVNFAEARHWHHKKIYSTFLMQYYLSVPYLGYLNDPSKPFTFIGNTPGTDFDLYLFCSNENDPLYPVIANDRNYYLVKRFEEGKAWVEFYTMAKTPEGL
jgi:hypothetical protein